LWRQIKTVATQQRATTNVRYIKQSILQYIKSLIVVSDAYDTGHGFSIARILHSERTPWQRQPRWYRNICSLHPHHICPNKNHQVKYSYL